MTIAPVALVAVTISILNGSVTVFVVIEPFTFVLAACLIMVNSFAMLLAIKEHAFIFIFVGVGYFSLVGRSVIHPLTVVDGAIGILQHPVAILPIFKPISDKLVSIFVEVSPFAVFLPTGPVSLVLLAIGIAIDPKPLLAVLVPLPLENCPSSIIVSPFSMFLSVYKFTMISFSVGVHIDSVSCILVLLPRSHIAVFVGKRVDAFTSSAVLVVSDVLAAVGVAYFLELAADFAGGVEELSQELFSHGLEGVGVSAGVVGLGTAAGLEAAALESRNFHLEFNYNC